MEAMGMKVFLLTLLTSAAAFADVNFDREVRPILSDNCFSCHGPDAKNRMANLRLDVPDGGLDPAKVLARVTNSDVAKRMPPAYSGHTLTPQQIDLIRQWIEQGAKWQPHWAFIAPKRPDAPAVKDTAWVRNPIDSFILAHLEKEGLKPSPAADKATLLRRVSYDLTGLPPTLTELNSFLADKSPDAYEKRVDALLKSPPLR